MSNMLVIHVFQEPTSRGQAQHMEYWFGFPDARGDFFSGDDTVICYCGAKLVPLKRNVKDASDFLVAGVWHNEEFHEDYLLTLDDEGYDDE